MTFKSKSLDITLDSGANVSYIRLSDAQTLLLDIHPNNQLAILADERTRLASLGEVDFLVITTVGQLQLRVRALVMKNLQASCFGGTTFHADNDITARIKLGEIQIRDTTVKQSNPVGNLPLFPPPCSDQHPNLQTIQSQSVGQQSFDSTDLPSEDLSRPEETDDFSSYKSISLPFLSVTLPDEHLSIPLPDHLTKIHYLSIIPNFPSIPEKVTDSLHWTPQVCEVINGSAIYLNTSRDSIMAPKYAHFKTQPVKDYSLSEISASAHSPRQPVIPISRLNSGKVNPNMIPPDTLQLISMIQINESLLNQSQISRLNVIHKENHKVFDNDLTEGYNHKSGQFYVKFTFTAKPPPTRVFVPQYNKRCSDIQQAKCDEMEAQGVLIDPKTFGIPILHVSPSWIQQKARAKNKNLQDCALEEVRFITAFNTLNDSIRPQPSRSCSSTSIFKFLSRWKFHIFGDLNNSYFQLPVQKSLWGYMGIMTPHKGVRVLTRTGQGLLGSDVELEELLCRVLGEDISAGHCLAVRDDIMIGGNTVDDAINNYEKVIVQLNKNNLKLSPNKVRLFPADTEIYGYRVRNGCIEPSEHRVSSIGKIKIESLTTVKSVNSWKGLYKTLIGHLPGLAMVMSPFDSATGGRNSRETFTWTPALTSAFNKAMSHLDQVNKTYLPAPHEKLLMLPDTMSVPPCTGWVMYTTRDNKSLPVTYCSAKLKEYMVKWFPCEQEAVGTVLAIEQCAHWICESEHPTMVGPDSSAVVNAAELIRRGKHSSNPRLQSLLASVNRRNVRFFHNSAKSGKHIVPDNLSRMKDTTCRSRDCAIERFLDDIPIKLESMSLTLLSICLEGELSPAVIAATSAELADLLTVRSGPIPLGSRQTWITIQKSDDDCKAIFKQKSTGDVPRKKTTNPIRNKIFKESIINQGLLVVREFDDKKMREVDKVVVPSTYLDSILIVIHIKLNHPSKYQLKQVYERYFFSPRLDGALDKLYNSCYICQGFRKFPKELDQFSPTLFPDHPGSHMNIDVIKRAGQLILVNIDLFSGYITACFTVSEQADDLSVFIIQVVTPIRHSDTVLVRVDKAPALQSLARDPTSDLLKLGIKLEIPLDDNKNSNCCVDKAINELEEELKKLSPAGEILSTFELAQAVTSLNNKIRNRGLTAAEIHFSRDSHDHQNLYLDDSKLQSQQKHKREENHGPSAKSKAPSGKQQVLPHLEQGEIVYIKSHGDKHTTRDPHIVIKDSDESSVLRKALHSSPQDTRPPSLSPLDRTVAKKFIFKPRSQRQLPPIPEERVVKIDCEAPETVDYDDHDGAHMQSLWHPLVQTGEDIIAICTTSEDESEDDNQPADIQPAQVPNIPLPVLDVAISPPASDIDDEDTDQIAVRIFNEGQGVDEDEVLDQNRPIKKNNLLAFFNSESGTWTRVKITSNPVKRKGWKHWFNFVYQDGAEDGMFFYPDLRWTFLDDRDTSVDAEENEVDEDSDDQIQAGANNDDPADVDDNEDQNCEVDDNEQYAGDDSSSESHEDIIDAPPRAIQQVDGNDAPDSVTPDTSPEILLGARPKTVIRIGPSDFLDSSEDTEDYDVNKLDRAAIGSSLEWDACGTDLETPLARDHTAHNLYEPIPLDRAVNLDEVLPITSTPIPRRKPRISAPRRTLPIEKEGNRPRFISKLNPFRKK